MTWKRRSRRARWERGSASIWVLLVIAGAFTVLLGLVVDGGAVIDARLDAARTARQAARLGADQLSPGSVRSGTISVDPAAAAAAVHEYLGAAGYHGTVRVSGENVTVTVTGTSAARILSAIGINSFPVRETGTAHGITGAGDP